MMGLINNRHLVVLASLVIILHKAQAKEDFITCFECTSVNVPECGITWGYGSVSQVPDELMVKCYGKHAACKKLISKDAPRATASVVRECWNTTDTDAPEENFHTCQDIMKAGESCFCRQDHCNGQGHLIASVSVGALALCASLLRHLF